MEIPDRLKSFPLYKGMLVHYTVHVRNDGVPDFRIVNEANRIRCAAEGLCNLCGQPLEPVMCFIGGERSGASRVFIDGPMHEECAKYSISVCPYLKNENWQHSEREAKAEPGYEIRTISAVLIGRPKMGLFYTDGYQLAKLEQGFAFVANKFSKSDWEAMPQP